jgi:hypothetical protein
MSYDDWKCSPPCPECGRPNCLCYDEGELELEPEVDPAEVVVSQEIILQSEVHRE